MELHEFLDQWRQSQGWSLQRFADELGVSQSLVSKWLHPDPRRRVRPNRATLRRISTMTGVSHLDLMRIAGYVDDEDFEAPVGPIDADLVAVTAAWPRLSSGVREAIRILVGAGGRVSGPSNGRVMGHAELAAEASDAQSNASESMFRNCKNPPRRPITLQLVTA